MGATGGLSASAAVTREKTQIGQTRAENSSGRCVFLLVGKDDMETQTSGI
jgi:hypothetical protein